MSLPIYHLINIRSIQVEDLNSLLNREINFKHPVALSLKLLPFDQQTALVGLIENFFSTNNLSYKYPYPVYLVMDQEKTITRMPSVKNISELPRFFAKKETKMNVKESYLFNKNTLLQQEIMNADAELIQSNIDRFGANHRKVFDLENERLFYRSILNQVIKVKKNG